MNTYDFIALDVETATSSKPRFVCQLGLAYVKNGVIEKTASYLIQPPENHIDFRLSRIHNITSADTENKPTFIELWEQLSFDLINNQIVAHNASFDQSVIEENLEYYNLPADLKDFKCTYRKFKLGLEDLCYGFKIDYVNHHDACFDAECCAKFYLNYLDEIEPDSLLIPKKKPKRKKHLYPKLDKCTANMDADCLNPFYNKRVVVTGVLYIDRNSLCKQLSNLGAYIRVSISGATDILIKGDKAGNSKMKQVDIQNKKGNSVEVIEENKLKELLKQWA